MNADAERNGEKSSVAATNQRQNQISANANAGEMPPEASAPVPPANHFSLKNELHLRRNLLKQNLNQKRPLETKATGISASYESSPVRHIRILEGASSQQNQKAAIREVEIA